VHCSQCGSENPHGKKFCSECGKELIHRCTQCGAIISSGGKFCGDCGAPLNAASIPRPIDTQTVGSDFATDQAEGERKIVTALFADLKGSTALMEGLDPEDAHAIVEPALQIMVEAVRRYDGYVVRTTGDGIFALFGAPVAYEDHPQRALYAALQMQQELRRYSASLVAKGGNPLEARVGVHTGEVVAYSVETSGKPEYRLIGHTANLASRLESVAPAGSIAIAESTRNLCEGYFAVKTMGPTPVKGIADPVNVYEVVGLGPLRSRLQRAAARGLTRFVGRQREMETLRQAAEQAKSGRGQLVAVMAEAGTGKSRLYFEFKAVSQSDWMVLEAFSVSHGKATAYLPLLDLVRDYMNITVDDDLRTRREKVNGRVLTLDRKLEDTLPHLFALLGISAGNDELTQMDAQVRRRRMHDAIKRILLRESLNQPLMLIFEDLHWIDSETQALLNALVDAIGNARILLLVNYRPEYRHEWGSRTHYTQLRLDPLGREGAGQMLDHLLGEDRALAALKRLIIERTEGNPFFMEETVQALLEEGALVRNGALKLTRPLDNLRMPLTVQAILSARIDRLPPADKELLQTLAVIGKQLDLALIQRVTGKSEAQLDPILTNLQLGEFVYEQPSIDGPEYTFKHALTQEVAYNSLLASRRLTTHEQAGSAIETVFAGQLEDHYSELAYHFLRSSNAAKAVHYSVLAAEQACSRAAYTAATNMIESALKLLDQLPSEPARLNAEFELRSIENATAFTLYGGASPQREQAIQRMCEVGEEIGGKKQIASLMTLANLYFQNGELKQGIELANRCLSLTDGTNDPSFHADAHVTAGLLNFSAGKLREAVTHHEHSLKYFKIVQASPSSRSPINPVGLPYMMWRGIALAGPLQLLGRIGEVSSLVEQTLRAARESRHSHGLAFVLTVSADPLRYFRREPERALVEAEEGIAISEENGLTYWLHRGRLARGWAHVELGHIEQGIDEMESAIAAAQATGRFPFWPLVMGRLGYACAKNRREQEGLSMLNKAIEETERTGAQMGQAEMLRLKGEVLQMVDDAAEAERCLGRAIEVARRQEARWWELRASVSLARLLAETNRRDQARSLLSKIYGWFNEGFELRDLQDAKTLLDQLSA
jgi:class 3 adenylate cyclase/tetratricopeptide (TPR) repeat protein